MPPGSTALQLISYLWPYALLCVTVWGVFTTFFSPCVFTHVACWNVQQAEYWAVSQGGGGTRHAICVCVHLREEMGEPSCVPLLHSAQGHFWRLQHNYSNNTGAHCIILYVINRFQYFWFHFAKPLMQRKFKLKHKVPAGGCSRLRFGIRCNCGKCYHVISVMLQFQTHH